jgi:cysteine desulfuration protein SufE
MRRTGNQRAIIENKIGSLKVENRIEDIEKEIIEEFALFDEWGAKYEYIIELGQKLPTLASKYKVDENRIKGCQSSVWLNAYEKDGKVFFEADSDSTFVKGEIALLIRVLSNQSPEDVVNADLKFIDAIGLRQHIAVTRANGLANMIKQMKIFALGLQSVNRSGVE